jgi:mRNA interferase MazF
VVARPRLREFWWAKTEEKRRPVLVCTRSDVIHALTTIVVAPVTRTVRGIPTEVGLGADEGPPEECVANFDNLQAIRRALLTDRLGELDRKRRHELCGALRAMSNC